MTQAITDASFILRALQSWKTEPVRVLEQLTNRVKTGQLSLITPTLFWFEVANALRFSERDREKARDIYRGIRNLPITTVAITPDKFQAILELSYQYQTTAYDTSYHYLALELDGTFFTCDKEYYRKAGKLGNIQLIAS